MHCSGDTPHRTQMPHQARGPQGGLGAGHGAPRRAWTHRQLPSSTMRVMWGGAQGGAQAGAQGGERVVSGGAQGGAQRGAREEIVLCGEEPREESVLCGEEPREAPREEPREESVLCGEEPREAPGRRAGVCMCVDDSVNVLVYVLQCAGVCDAVRRTLHGPMHVCALFSPVYSRIAQVTPCPACRSFWWYQVTPSPALFSHSRMQVILVVPGDPLSRVVQPLPHAGHLGGTRRPPLPHGSACSLQHLLRRPLSRVVQPSSLQHLLRRHPLPHGSASPACRSSR